MPPESAAAQPLQDTLQDACTSFWPTFSPPEADHPSYEDWRRLRDDSRKTVQATLSVCEQVWLQLRLGKKLTTAAKSVARLMGWNTKSAWQKPARLWESYQASGFDWKSCVDKRHEPAWWDTHEQRVILPAGVKERFKALSEKCQRDCKTAHQLLLADLDMWRRGRGPAIAGYDSPPPNAPGKRHPAGWSYANLMRHGSSLEELAAARDGREAALKGFPAVRTTRAGSYPLAEVQFDDMWEDATVRVVSGNKYGIRRVLGFGAIDHYTAYLFKPGLKPRLPDENEEKMKHLTEADFRFYVAWFLTHVGYNTLGTVFNLEHGTATLRAEIAAAITRLTGGCVTIKMSGMTGKPALAGQFEGRSKGNFRAKALKEGIGKLLHNRLSHLPGQVGQSHDKLPAQHHGMAKQDEFLMALSIVAPEIGQDLKYNMCLFTDYQLAVISLYNQLNERRDHAIEGYEEDRLVAKEFTFDPDAKVPVWQDLKVLNNLPEDKRAIVEAMIAKDPRMARVELLSPAEVFEPVMGEFKKLPYYCLPEIVGRDLGLLKMVDRKCFEIGGKFYLAEVRDKAGFPKQLTNGERYLVFLNPFARERLIVCDEKTMAYLGECKPWDIAPRAEADAIQAQVQERGRLMKDALAGATVRLGLGKGANHAANVRAINAGAKKILASRPGPDAQRLERRQAAAAKGEGDLRELLDKAPAETSAPFSSAPAGLLQKVGAVHDTARSDEVRDNAAPTVSHDANDDDDLSQLLDQSGSGENQPF